MAGGPGGRSAETELHLSGRSDLRNGGNRFDAADWGSLYFATDLEGCFAETLAAFRPSSALLAASWSGGPSRCPCRRSRRLRSGSDCKSSDCPLTRVRSAHDPRCPRPRRHARLPGRAVVGVRPARLHLSITNQTYAEGALGPDGVYQDWALPVGLAGIEPATSALSVLRSNRLSYSPELHRSGGIDDTPPAGTFGRCRFTPPPRPPSGRQRPPSGPRRGS
jgi:hypothetical protein